MKSEPLTELRITLRQENSKVFLEMLLRWDKLCLKRKKYIYFYRRFHWGHIFIDSEIYLKLWMNSFIKTYYPNRARACCVISVERAGDSWKKISFFLKPILRKLAGLCVWFGFRGAFKPKWEYGRPASTEHWPVWDTCSRNKSSCTSFLGILG